MCGIIGIASNKPVSINIINSLKKLEYRGYDSAGLATLNNNKIDEKKCSGRVEELEKILFKNPSQGNLGIGHVRWATHGVPNVLNAHPHSSEIVSVVHNGIIENSDELKQKLETKGVKFKSQTDTEVITLLITEALKTDDPLESVFKTLKQLKGSFALGIIFKDKPDIIHTIGLRSFQSVAAWMVSKKYNIPLIATDQGGLTTHPFLKETGFLFKIIFKIQDSYIKKIIKHSSTLCAANEYERDIFLEIYNKSKVKIVRNGVDLRSLVSKVDFKEKYDIKSNFIVSAISFVLS